MARSGHPWPPLACGSSLALPSPPHPTSARPGRHPGAAPDLPARCGHPWPASRGWGRGAPLDCRRPRGIGHAGGRPTGGRPTVRWFRTIVTVALTASVAGLGRAVPAPASSADHPAAPFDTTFNGSGLVVTRLDQQALTAQDVVVQPDGAIVVAAPIVFPQGQGALLARYTPAGGLDATFGSGGVAAIPEGHTGGLVLDSQRRIVSGGNAEVVRLLPDGTPDPSFTSANLSPLRITGVAVLPDDRIVAVGQRIDPTSTRVRLVVARLLPTGARDTTFNPTGSVPGEITYEPFGKIGAAVSGVALQADGSVVTAGVTTANGATEGFVVRFTPGGALDASFA